MQGGSEFAKAKNQKKKENSMGNKATTSAQYVYFKDSIACGPLQKTKGYYVIVLIQN